jgi:HTH-type transcriptional regulator/antitoxin HigA
VDAVPTNPIPARAVAPGRILRRELDARGWTQKDLADILGRPAQAITEIVRTKKQITPDTAVALGSAFGTSAAFWWNLEARYRLALAQGRARTANDVARKARVHDWMPVGELAKRRWLVPGKTISSLERAACTFFGVETVGEEPRLVVSLRHAPSNGGELAAHRAWVKRVEHLAQAQSVGPFEPARLVASIPRIVRNAASVDGVTRVAPLLGALGIRFLVVPPLSRARIDGAAAFTPAGPVVALSMRLDRIDHFWFTLLHELAHLALEHRGGHLDGESDAGEIDTEETRANALASGWLLRDDELASFAARQPGAPSKAAIRAFAKERRLHAGVVVGRLQQLGLLAPTQYRGMVAPVRTALEPWTDRA